MIGVDKFHFPPFDPFSGSKSSKKALIICLVLVAANQLSGCFAFINYTAEIFMQSGSSLSPNSSAIIVAAIQVAGSTVSTFAIGSMSRKLLFTLTCFGTMGGLLAFGTHGYLKVYYDLTDFNWVPIASLSFVIFIASVGLLPLTFVMLSEILPQKVSKQINRSRSTRESTGAYCFFSLSFTFRFAASVFHSARLCSGRSRFSSSDILPPSLPCSSCTCACLFFASSPFSGLFLSSFLSLKRATKAATKSKEP